MKSIAPPEEDLDESKPVKEKTEATESDEEAEIDKQITELEKEELREQKRKRKKTLKERKKLNEKLNLKMVLKGDDGPKLEGDEMFNLKEITSNKQLEKVTDQAPDVLAESDNEDDGLPKPKYQKYSKDDTHLDSSGLYYKDSDSELEMESEEDDEEIGEGLGFSDSDSETRKPAKKEKKQKEKTKDHPLITDLDYRDKDQKRAHKAELFFERDVFKNLIDEKDEDADLDKMVADYRRKGKKILGEEEPKESKKNKSESTDSDYSSDESDTESEAEDYDIEKEYGNMQKKGGAAAATGKVESKKQKRKLTVEDLALGTMMVNSKKTKRDLIDAGWNRYAFNDDNLPDWFVQDESKHMKKEVPVPKVSFSCFCRRNSGFI